MVPDTSTYEKPFTRSSNRKTRRKGSASSRIPDRRIMSQLYNTSSKISIVLPCLNEENSIDISLTSIISVIKKHKLNAEVILVDNNSSDSTAKKIKLWANTFRSIFLVEEKEKGYGKALMKGIGSATGEYVYMADCDNTYDFEEIPLFIQKLNEGNDMVIGNRFSGKMKEGAMPIHKKYIGNPFLSFITRLFFGIRIHDIHCGARAFRLDAYKRLSLYTAGMEFASEMIIKAAKKNLKIAELPISYGKRIGTSKLETIGDGWRHLRFILLYSPLVTFLVPGTFLFVVGLACMGIFYAGSPRILDIQLFFHPMFLFSSMIITGYQLIFFSMFAKIYAITHLGDNDPLFDRLFKIFTIEKAGVLGTALALIGACIYAKIFLGWVNAGFGTLNEIKNSILALTFVTVGIQTFFSAFMLSTLGIKEK